MEQVTVTVRLVTSEFECSPQGFSGNERAWCRCTFRVELTPEGLEQTTMLPGTFVILERRTGSRNGEAA
jgi:hypothetical protein